MYLNIDSQSYRKVIIKNNNDHQKVMKDDQTCEKSKESFDKKSKNEGYSNIQENYLNNKRLNLSDVTYIFSKII